MKTEPRKCLLCSVVFQKPEKYPRVLWERRKYCSRSCSGIANSTGKFGERHNSWKGEAIGYRAIHQWADRVLGRPTTCENCGKDNLQGHSVHWANKSGEYLRELTDWLRLCAKCHKNYDVRKQKTVCV